MNKHVEVTWAVITQAEYWDALCDLPPVAQRGKGFLMGEPADRRECSVDGAWAPRYTAYVAVSADQHVKSLRPLTVKEWRALTLTTRSIVIVEPPGKPSAAYVLGSPC